MKIFISCALFYPAKLGGPANTLYWLAKGIVSAGHEVCVVTTHNYIDNKDIPYNNFIIIDGIKVIYCSSRYLLIKKSLEVLPKCDAVLLSSVCYSPELLISVWARMYKKRVIWSPRGELAESAIGGSIVKLAFFKLIKVLAGKYAIFHATSEDENTCIKRILGRNVKSIIIPNYMEVPQKRERQRCESPYFLFLGRIAPIKAIENLINGAALSNKFKQSSFVLKIAGGIENQFNDYYNSLIKVIGDNNLQNKVEFVGAVSGNEKFQIYCNAEFLFLVSKSENFGNVVIEALSQGTPVVASYGTPWKGLEEKNAGFWIDNSPQTISQTIDKILDMNSKEYWDYRRNAFAYAESFDIYKNINTWIKNITL